MMEKVPGYAGKWGKKAEAKSKKEGLQSYKKRSVYIDPGRRYDDQGNKKCERHQMVKTGKTKVVTKRRNLPHTV